MANGTAVVLANEIVEDGGFTGDDGKFVQGYRAILDEPVEGHSEGKFWGKDLYDILTGGPAEVKWETKTTKQGPYLKLNKIPGTGSQGNNSRASQGNTGANQGKGVFHASPETVAMKLAELSVTGKEVTDDDIWDTYEAFFVRVTALNDKLGVS